MAIFGINAIADKATRDAIIALQNQIGGGSGNITVQAEDPSDDVPGVEGDIIYASDTDSIWVFVGTEWERAVGGNATYIQVRATVPRSTNDYGDWNETSSVYKNDGGNNKALVATVVQNGAEFSDTEHEDFTYVWYKNGQDFTPITQNDNTGKDKRALLIGTADITNGGSEAFICAVTY